MVRTPVPIRLVRRSNFQRPPTDDAPISCSYLEGGGVCLVPIVDHPYLEVQPIIKSVETTAERAGGCCTDEKK
ncbi:hypothetical protein ACLI4U_17900 [Natrialbaceae archaeon A-CW2]|uniref:hypothetical protein n=1 Tax=Natronosalvus amylolyticus TaxID=2961994 RepID=UPI0020C9B7D8|nr:hypothetical protein [Natronosalvus amylolyticus]